MGLQSYVTQLAINRSRCCSEMGRAAGGGGGARGGWAALPDRGVGEAPGRMAGQPPPMGGLAEGEGL